MRKKMNIRKLAFAMLALLIAVACGKKEEKPAEAAADKVLVQVGDSSLMMSDVLPRIPAGLAPEDSTALFSAIVDAWVERLLLEDFGRENIEDMDRINRLTAEYRSRLIAESYRQSLRRNQKVKTPGDSIDAYYRSHLDELKLQEPLVKGLLIKLPDDVANLRQIRQWVFSGKSEDIDNIEKTGLKEALQYSFFEDRWVDFRTVAEQIPYRFTNPDNFVATRKNFETTVNGTTYLLHISSFIKSGQTMPEEYARPYVSAILDTESAADYERRLIERLYSQAKKDGKMKTVNYDPITHSMISNK